MIIGRQFAWAHLPKTGGDATFELFQLFPDLVVFAHSRKEKEKHNRFRAHEAKITGKLLVMNIRRLPAWMLSMSQHQTHYWLHPKHEHPSVESTEQMSRSRAPDHQLRSFMGHGQFKIDVWFRTEYLVEDFISFVSRFTEVTPEREDRAHKIGRINQMSYAHELKRWFTKEQIADMYQSNPLWRSVEDEVYADPLGEVQSMAAKTLNFQEEERELPREIIRVTRRWSQPVKSSELAGFSVDFPTPGWTGMTYDFALGGWIVAARQGPVAVEAVHRGVVLRKVKANVHRPDVQEKFPDLPHAASSGFSMRLGTPGLPPSFEVLLRAVLSDGVRVPLAALEGSHAPLVSSYKSSLAPLMVTMMGRVGSSWLMRLLAQHPSIIVRPPRPGDPYETRVASYWMHMLKVLSEPADLDHSTRRNDFTTERKWIGHNPFYVPSMTQQPRMQDWFGRLYPEHLAEFCQWSIEQFYLQVARETQKAHPVYFAEKFHADHIPWLAWELYPRAREIVLIRDFRDMVSSILAFNKKRGFLAFGREKVDSDLAYIDKMRNNVLSFLRAWELRSDRTFLLRYEDLVSDSEPTLERLMNYLGIDVDVRDLLEKAKTGSGELSEHRTIKDATTSIGRWKMDLEPELQEAISEAFSEALAAFGYE